MIRITETQSTMEIVVHENALNAESKSGTLQKYGYISQIYGSHNNPAARKQGISQFDTLVVSRGQNYLKRTKTRST